MQAEPISKKARGKQNACSKQKAVKKAKDVQDAEESKDEEEEEATEQESEDKEEIARGVQAMTPLNQTRRWKSSRSAGTGTMLARSGSTSSSGQMTLL